MTTKQSITDPNPFRLAVASTFTAEPLQPVIAFWGRELKTDFDLQFANYNQVMQALLDPNGLFGTNTHGVNVVLLRLEDLWQFSEAGTETLAALEHNVRSLIDILRAAPARLHVPLLVTLCPPSAHFCSVPERAALYRQLAILMGAALDETPGLQYLPWDEVQALYPVRDQHNEQGERLGKIPYTEAWYCALGTGLVRHTHALFRAPFKLIALDCDNTLWRGVCGEDGPEGVLLDAPRRALHCCMLDQREDGMLLAMASKNNEQDVLETFRAHPEMPLQLHHFVTWRLNWEAKADNLASISDQLGIGADSFIFIDDNPKECAELEQALPEVLTLVLPDEIERTAHFLRHVWAFDHPVVTEEDRNRSAYYGQAAEFGNAVRRAGSLSEFIRSLQLSVTVRPLEPGKLPRVAQLTQRTNQFNTTTIRRSESEITSLLTNGVDCFTVEVADRFGDYGLTGAVFVSADDGAWRIDNLLLSCRVLGRGVEHRVVSALAGLAMERGIGKIVLPYVQSAKNLPARQFLECLHGTDRVDTEGGFVLATAPGKLAGIEWQPETHVEQPQAKKEKSPPAVHRTARYARIANELSTVDDILRAMRAETAPATAEERMSATEAQVAAIWAELLEKPGIGRDDNFFDLGGHSLIAVLLLMRVRETFGVELSIDDVYTGSLTVADLAARIEAAQLGDIDPEQYAALIAEIENLSDDEARELLERENAGQA